MTRSNEFRSDAAVGLEQAQPDLADGRHPQQVVHLDRTAGLETDRLEADVVAVEDSSGSDEQLIADQLGAVVQAQGDRTVVPGATVDDIANTAGVSHATVFSRFGSRLGILDALTDRCNGSPEIAAIRATFEIDDPLIRLASLVSASSTARRSPPRWMLTSAETFHELRRHGDLDLEATIEVVQSLTRSLLGSQDG